MKIRSVPIVMALAVVMALSAGCSSAPGAAGGPPPLGTALDDGPPRVTTTLGEVVGLRDGGVVRFDGIPYAQAPTGELRFAAPQPVQPWTEPLEATAPAEQCLQPGDDQAPSGSEDCLFVNVTAPAAPSDEPRPVMVWLHGGSFERGSAAGYDPARLAAEGDVVVVTVGFRLGPLGMLALPGLDGGGTFGLLDQIAALRFVQENANAFGGDAGNVTLFGESGGASAVCHLMTSPQTAGLVHRAIVQSAPECGATAPPNAYSLPYDENEGYVEPSMLLADVAARGVDAAARLGCQGDGTPECLRSLEPAAFLPIHTEFTNPAVGTAVSPVAPIEALPDVSIPVLAGYTRDESRYFAILGVLLGTPWTPGAYESAIRVSFPDDAEEILAEYPLSSFDGDAEAWSAVYTDRTFACPQLHANDILSRGTDVYAYEFADRSAASPLPLIEGAPRPGAAHSAELHYLFDMAAQPIDINGELIALTDPQRALASAMIEVWAGFARTGTAPVPMWTDGQQALNFDENGTSTIDPAERHRCGFWDISG